MLNWNELDESAKAAKDGELLYNVLDPLQGVEGE